MQQRIELAKRLLRDPQQAIADVAIQCGFANQSHFRQLVGITPKIYRGQ
jgi:AraC family transcriptional regulator